MAKKLAYCLDNQIIEEDLNIIFKMILIDDEELFEMCIDTLRAFEYGNPESFSIKSILLSLNFIISRISSTNFLLFFQYSFKVSITSLSFSGTISTPI